MSETEHRVLAYLREQTGSVRAVKIAEALQAGESTVEQAIRALRDAHLVTGPRTGRTVAYELIRSGEKEIPAGSTVVEIDLTPHQGETSLRLVHRGLDGPMADAHDGGWTRSVQTGAVRKATPTTPSWRRTNYLSRLAALVEGRYPGPDPLAAQRVPSTHEF
jgi:DNA-binding transcriptional ArsR family regulator